MNRLFQVAVFLLNVFLAFMIGIQYGRVDERQEIRAELLPLGIEQDDGGSWVVIRNCGGNQR